MDVPADRTADGLDRQTATNYYGPFVLTNLLLPHLRDRVVHVTSQLHRFTRPAGPAATRSPPAVCGGRPPPLRAWDDARAGSFLDCRPCRSDTSSPS